MYCRCNNEKLIRAQADLDARVNAFCQERFKAFDVERDALVKETRQGENKKKVRELAAAIKKRLDATPATPTLNSAPPVSPTLGHRDSRICGDKNENYFAK